MATLTYKILKDHVKHKLGAVSGYVTDIEIYSAMADFVRDLVSAIRPDEMVHAESLTIASDTNSVSIPTSMVEIKAVSHNMDGGSSETFIDLLSYSEVEKRQRLSRHNRQFGYAVGRTFYINFELEEDTAFNFYCIERIEEDVVDSSVALGSANTALPIWLSKLLVIGVVQYLLEIYAIKEIDVAKADRLFKKYEREKADLATDNANLVQTVQYNEDVDRFSGTSFVPEEW